MITGKIIAIEEDQLRNIIIWICFTQDSKEIPFYRNAELLERDGHKVWPLYAIYENFLGRTQAERVEWIKINIEHQIGNLIKEQFKSQNIPMIENLKKDCVTLTVEKDSQEIELYSRGVVDKIATIKTDGTYTIVNK